jgi:hypothetical protein
LQVRRMDLQRCARVEEGWPMAGVHRFQGPQ